MRAKKGETATRGLLLIEGGARLFEPASSERRRHAHARSNQPNMNRWTARAISTARAIVAKIRGNAPASTKRYTTNCRLRSSFTCAGNCSGIIDE